MTFLRLSEKICVWELCLRYVRCFHCANSRVMQNNLVNVFEDTKMRKWAGRWGRVVMGKLLFFIYFHWRRLTSVWNEEKNVTDMGESRWQIQFQNEQCRLLQQPKLLQFIYHYGFTCSKKALCTSVSLCTWFLIYFPHFSVLVQFIGDFWSCITLISQISLTYIQDFCRFSVKLCFPQLLKGLIRIKLKAVCW